AHHELGCDLGERTTGGLRYEGDGARSARIDLDHVDAAVFDRELNVHQTDHAELQSQRAGVSLDFGDDLRIQRVWWQYAGGISGMHAGFLDVLHDATDHDAAPVGHAIHVDLDCVLQVLIDEQGGLEAFVAGRVDRDADVVFE